MITKKIIVKDIPTNYNISDSFNNKKTTFFFLHWRGQNGLSFESIYKLMDKDGLSYIDVDFPWFGNSPRPKNTRWIREYTEFIKEFIKKVHLTNIICIAHSFWCRVAFEISAEDKNIFTQQILIWPAGVEKKSLWIKNQITLLSFIKRLFPKYIVSKAKQILWSRDYKNANTMKDIFIKVINHDQSKLFHKIIIPTTILRWTKDIEVPAKEIEVMKKEIRDIKIIVFEWAGHFLFQENPTQTYKVIKETLFV